MVAWMKIVKSEAPGQFFVVGMDVAKNQRLNLTERGMLLTLLSLPPDWNFTVEGMTKILPDGRDRIRTTMNNLKKYGYVRRVQGRRGDGSFESGHMEIYHRSFDTIEFNEKLCSLHKKALVDYQIERIKAHYYIGYMNFDRIDQMCKEYEARKTVSPPKKKNSFHYFHERDYPPGYWEEL